MRTIRTIIIASLLLSAALPAAEERPGSIIGTVIDVESRSPVAAATVSVLGTSFTVKTAVDGQYRIDGVPEGFYQVKAEAASYTAQVLNNIYVGEGNGKVTAFFSLTPTESTKESGEVDVQPTPIQPFVAPHYPEQARKKGIEGTVYVKMLVSEKGVVKNAQVIQSDAEILNKASIDAAMKWRFTPGAKNGKAVSTWIVLPFKFKLGPEEGQPKK